MGLKQARATDEKMKIVRVIGNHIAVRKPFFAATRQCKTLYRCEAVMPLSLTPTGRRIRLP